MPRLLDVFFFIYFLTHIPITVLIDLQAIFPSCYPKQLVDLKLWYCHEFRDPLMLTPPAWFKPFLYAELFLQFPFFFVATYAYFKGAKACSWIRLPAVIYGTHVATTLICIGGYIMFNDFTDPEQRAPKTTKDRLQLLGIYLPYFLIPIMIVLDAAFSSVYKTNVPTSRSQKKRQ